MLSERKGAGAKAWKRVERGWKEKKGMGWDGMV